MTAAAAVNYSNAYDSPSPFGLQGVDSRIASWTTADLYAAYAFKAAKISATIQNIADRRPPQARPPTFYDVAQFDPTNASFVGRLFALKLTKDW